MSWGWEIIRWPAAGGALVIKGDPQARDHYRAPSRQERDPHFSELVKAEFPSVSINLYSGKDWIADRLDKWVQIERLLQVA